MDPVSEDELISSFGDPEGDVWVPSLGDVDFESLDYLGWVHPSGHLGYMALVSPNSGALQGVVLKRQLRKAQGVRLEMCSFCNHVHRMDGTAMFTVSVKGSGGRHRIGRVGCANLDCSLRIRNLVEPDSLMRESLYVEARVWRMQLAVHRWLDKAQRL